MNISVKWLGHSSFEIKSEGKIIYIDPYEGKYSEKADLILVTHSHFDHCDLSKIKEARQSSTTIIAPEDCVPKIGGDVRTLKPAQETTVGGIRVKAVEAYNIKRFRTPGNPFHPKGFGVGYLITIGDKKIYHAGDSDFIPEMKQLGQIDLALLPTGGTYTMDNPESVEAALAINPKVTIPMHRWDTDPQEFRKKVESNSRIKVVVLSAGEEFQVV